MKKILTIAVWGEDLNLNPEFEEVEIIKADDAWLKKCKSKYAVFLNSGSAYCDLRPLLDRAESSSADIIAFTDGCLFKTSSIRHIDAGADIFNMQISCILSCKSIEKTSFTPFNLTKNTDCGEAAEKLISAVKDYTSAKTKVPVDVYSYARDIICERLVLFYKSYMLAMRSGADGSLLAELDRQIKALDVVLYKVFENRYGHAELEKLKTKNFKISFITAIKYKSQLKVK